MRKVLIYAAALSILWSALVVALLVVVEEREEKALFEVSLAEARTIFQQVVDVRSWNASHGGIYVEVSDSTPPNPYLDVPERDIVTTSGRRMTLVNPAYMTRQIAEGAGNKGAAVHITSLRPLRPGNSALPWERDALLAFEAGREEHAGFFGSAGEGTVFRYMAPLRVEESCLRCHAAQGYSVGDIRGGISVTLPAGVLVEAHGKHRRKDRAAAAATWLVGLGIVLVTAAGGVQRQKMLERLRDLSLVDELTGLRNRRGFMTLAAQQIEIARRWGRTGLLLFIDVDYLKRINDNFGHGEGDKALRRTARVLGASLRRSDVAARIGGDEFAVFCMDGSLERSRAILAALAENLEAENGRAGGAFRLSFTVGAVEFDPEGEEGLEGLLARADGEMYAKKKSRPAVTGGPAGTGAP